MYYCVTNYNRLSEMHDCMYVYSVKWSAVLRQAIMAHPQWEACICAAESLFFIFSPRRKLERVSRSL